MPGLTNAWHYTATPPYVITAWRLMQHRQCFTSTVSVRYQIRPLCSYRLGDRVLILFASKIRKMYFGISSIGVCRRRGASVAIIVSALLTHKKEEEKTAGPRFQHLPSVAGFWMSYPFLPTSPSLPLHLHAVSDPRLIVPLVGQLGSLLLYLALCTECCSTR